MTFSTRGPAIRLLVATVAAAALACARVTEPVEPREPLLLRPLSPGVHTFATPRGAGRNTYVFVSEAYRADEDWRTELVRLLRQHHTTLGPPPPVDSLYVYVRTDVLNERFHGDAAALRGVHDEHLVAYARWTNGEEDIVWLIEHGQVVRDLRADAPVQPFDFD